MGDVFGTVDEYNETDAGSSTGGRWWAGAELNCRHQDFQSCALPTELPARPGHESREPGAEIDPKRLLVKRPAGSR
jgi:hypothetical protein